MKDEIWDALDKHFNPYPFLKSDPGSPEEIEAASTSIGIAFPDDYTAFLLRYGGAIVGPWPIYGIRNAEAMGTRTVVGVNRWYRADNYPGIDKWLIISSDHAGNAIGIDIGGRILVSDHDFGGIYEIADNFEAFIAGLLGLD